MCCVAVGGLWLCLFFCVCVFFFFFFFLVFFFFFFFFIFVFFFFFFFLFFFYFLFFFFFIFFFFLPSPRTPRTRCEGFPDQLEICHGAEAIDRTGVVAVRSRPQEGQNLEVSLISLPQREQNMGASYPSVRGESMAVRVPF
jgi:hypothetical protein